MLKKRTLCIAIGLIFIGIIGVLSCSKKDTANSENRSQQAALTLEEAQS